MDVFPQAIAPVIVLRPQRFEDERGFFCELYNQRLLQEHGIGGSFVQDNVSLSRRAGTVRGLHFQPPPSEQAKLISVLKGAVLDVVVDLRRGSPTYGRHVSVELSAENGLQMVAPKGFAHGFCSLLPDTLVHYKVDGYYDRDRDLGLRWNDPALGIHWPVDPQSATVSIKDREQPLLADIPAYFHYSEGRT
jgi:dTDP-4-dehydrorhamnose 3,5-epimerase